MAEEVTKLMTIPLSDSRRVPPKTKRAPHAIKYIKQFVARHMKCEVDKVWIDQTLNEKIWERSISNPPRKVRVKVIKFEDGLTEVSLFEEEGN